MADDPQHEAAIRLIDDTIEAVGQEVCGVSWVPTAETPRAILAALIQAGWTPPDPDAWECAVQATRDALAALDGPAGWEWGVRDPDGTLIFHGPRDGQTEKDARLYANVGDVVVRRRPAGPWEPAPAPADPTSEEHRP